MPSLAELRGPFNRPEEDPSLPFLYHVDHDSTVAELRHQIRVSNGYNPSLIFNYPPISIWRPPAARFTVSDLWQDFTPYNFPLNLYVHIPYCVQKCHFCYYNVNAGRDNDQVTAYLNALEKEACLVAHRFEGMKFKTVYVGGGTPTYPNADQLRFLFERVFSKFDLSEAEEITFESSPDTITEEKMICLRESGADRISMGIQSFDPGILRATNRNSDSRDMILEAYRAIVNAGFKNFNFDMIAGLQLETPTQFEDSMQTALNLSPPPPHYSLFTLNLKPKSGNVSVMKRLEKSAHDVFVHSLEQYNHGVDILEAHGYWQFSRNCFVKRGTCGGYRYQENIWGRNGYVLGLGSSAYSHSRDYVYMNNFSTTQYMSAVHKGELPVEKHYPLTHRETVARYLVLAFKHTNFDVDEADSYLGDDFRADFGRELEALCAEDIVEYDGKVAKYRRDGVAACDRYCRLFYTPDVRATMRRRDMGEDGRIFSDGFAYER